MSEKRNDKYVRRYLAKADRTLSSAELLLKDEAWYDGANRPYYAVFYSAKAVLASINVVGKTHRSVRNEFNRYVHESDTLNSKHAATFNKLALMRNEGDYGDDTELTATDVEVFILPTTNLVADVRSLLAAEEE